MFSIPVGIGLFHQENVCQGTSFSYASLSALEVHFWFFARNEPLRHFFRLSGLE